MAWEPLGAAPGVSCTPSCCVSCTPSSCNWHRQPTGGQVVLGGLQAHARTYQAMAAHRPVQTQSAGAILQTGLRHSPSLPLVSLCSPSVLPQPPKHAIRAACASSSVPTCSMPTPLPHMPCPTAAPPMAAPTAAWAALPTVVVHTDMLSSTSRTCKRKHTKACPQAVAHTGMLFSTSRTCKRKHTKACPQAVAHTGMLFSISRTCKHKYTKACPQAVAHTCAAHTGMAHICQNG